MEFCKGYIRHCPAWSGILVTIGSGTSSATKPLHQPRWVSTSVWVKKLSQLTHCGPVTPYGVIDLGQHKFRTSDNGPLSDITKPLLKWFIGSLSIHSRGTHSWWCYHMDPGNAIHITCPLWGESQWHHMSIMMSQITCNWTAWSTFCSAKKQDNMKAWHYWPFVRGIHQSLVDSPHKGPVMQKAFPYDDIILTVASYGACQYHVILSWPVRTPAQTPDNGTDNAWQSKHSSMHSPQHFNRSHAYPAVIWGIWWNWKVLR